MAGITLELDPTSEDASNANLVIADNTGTYFLLGFDAAPPQAKLTYAESVDTEGSIPVEFKYENRRISAQVRCVEGLTQGGPYTNLISNPSGETGTSGWTGSGSLGTTAIFQSATRSVTGAYSLRFTTANSTGSAQTGGRMTDLIAMSPGTTVVGRMWVYNAGTIASVRVRPRFVQSDGTTSAGFGTDATTTTTGAWVELSGTWVAPAGTAYCRFEVYGSSSGSGQTVDIYFDAASLVVNNTLVDYFDGDTPGATWAGTPHGSTSVLAASGGPRLQSIINVVQKKAHKINAENGTLKIGLPSGTSVVADVCSMTVTPQLDRQFTTNNRAILTYEWEALPLLRGSAVTKTLRSEATLPCLVFTETGITGDVPALGRLVINEAQGQDQWWVIWGQQSRYYDSASSAGLFFEAEGRTAMGGSATAIGASGASGSGSNVMRNTSLATSYQAILSTQATGGGAHLSHVGDFRVFARVQVPTSNAGTVSVAFEWAEGDFRRWTRNAGTDFRSTTRGAWWLVDLGQVHLSKVPQGTQRWEGRIVASSTIAGDDIDVDYLMLVPVTEGSGEVSATPQVSSATSFSARDEFDQAAGALTGKTLPIGGTWAGAGDADDWQATGSSTFAASRAPGGADAAGVGRWATASTPSLSACAVQAALTISPGNSAASARSGIVCRYVDTSNHLRADYTLTNAAGGAVTALGIEVSKVVAGTRTVLATLSDLTLSGSVVRLVVDSAGRWWAFNSTSYTSTALKLFAFGQDSVLATAGTLASGKVGIYGETSAATTPVTYADDFAAWVPAIDAALFASQSLEVRHNAVYRKDSGGTLWPEVSSYEGDYLLVPPAGKENRTLRMVIKACRNDPTAMPDPAIDDISAQLTYTPRFLVLPE